MTVGGFSEELYEAFTGDDPGLAIAVVERARDAGVPRDRLFDEVFMPAMAMLGQAWAEARIDEVRFTQAAVVAEQLTSFVLPAASPADTGVTIVAGCVQGDRHETGRNIIVATLKEAGHRVIDLGTDVRPAVFLEKVEETGARLVIAFAEMMETAEVVRRLRDMLDVGGHEDVVLLVSGGPFEADARLAKRLGANGVVSGAEGALRIVARVIQDRLAGGSS
ncbi:MAG: corrinoid protein [Coriobacteriia bacterium]